MLSGVNLSCCKICGDEIPADVAIKANGKPRVFCLACRPGGPNLSRDARSGPRVLDEVEFARLVASGLSASQIGKKLGCSRQNVYACANRRGLKVGNGSK